MDSAKRLKLLLCQKENMVYLTLESYVMMAGMIDMIKDIQEKLYLSNEHCRTEYTDAALKMFL
jgi:hypothetical protein